MANREANNAVPCRRQLCLLIVEDSAADAELTVAVLQRAGHTVTFDLVDSPQHLRQQLQQADYDIILADYNLRSWTAMDALEILKQSGKDIPFIMVTGSLGDEAAVECIKRGAADYILKDRVRRLPMAVERALHERALRRDAARLQELIQQAKKEWERTFDTVPDPVFVCDEQCIIKRANRAAAELLGLKPAELVGKSCEEMFYNRTEPYGKRLHARAVETRQVQRADIEEPRQGRHFDVTVTPLQGTNSALRGCIHVLRDITERKRVEEELNRAQKMEAIGRLAGGIAHDFNNLLAVIIGYSELLLDQLEPAGPLYKKAEGIKSAGEHAALITRQLLTFSRKQVVEPRVLDLDVVVAETGKLLERLIGENIDLVIRPAAAGGRVKADPGQIEQVILNLALNARDAMPEGGKLTIETANVEMDEVHSRRHVQIQPGSYVMLAVSDTGCGIDPESQAHIFEPFFTTKEPGKGTGLGLATVYGIVKQCEGYIWLYSEPGKGATFKIYLPPVLAPVAVAELTSAGALPLAGSETILLVEDEEPVREVARECLQMRGYRVLEASNGEEAVHLALRHPGPIHLMLTDVVMPGMSGCALAQRLALLRPGMKVLYMSGYADDAVVHHGLLEPGKAFLQKPFRGADLARRVREVLQTTNMQPPRH